MQKFGDPRRKSLFKKIQVRAVVSAGKLGLYTNALTVDIVNLDDGIALELARRSDWETVASALRILLHVCVKLGDHS